MRSLARDAGAATFCSGGCIQIGRLIKRRRYGNSLVRTVCVPGIAAGRAQSPPLSAAARLPSSRVCSDTALGRRSGVTFAKRTLSFIITYQKGLTKKVLRSKYERLRHYSRINPTICEEAETRKRRQSQSAICHTRHQHSINSNHGDGPECTRRQVEERRAAAS